ncbi:uncharacterized protein [Aegilops tauschii subsp. strangulata]|uniref:uncharacterized protein isoform X1 n=1 Tax=Aegilops tauschii subsp. strangulata TaxID=200361 RepID=UPI003CC8B21D
MKLLVRLPSFDELEGQETKVCRCVHDNMRCRNRRGMLVDDGDSEMVGKDYERSASSTPSSLPCGEDDLQLIDVPSSLSFFRQVYIIYGVACAIGISPVAPEYHDLMRRWQRNQSEEASGGDDGSAMGKGRSSSRHQQFHDRIIPAC